MPNIFTYPNASSVVVCGDIHGEFESLVFSICVQYDMHDDPSYFAEQKIHHERFRTILDTVITHTAPSFCELQTKNGLTSWAANDPNLLQDCDNEREQMDMLFTHLKQDKHPVTHWFYGHFHQSWHGEMFGVFFKMLDIMELHELR